MRNMISFLFFKLLVCALTLFTWINTSWIQCSQFRSPKYYNCTILPQQHDARPRDPTLKRCPNINHMLSRRLYNASHKHMSHRYIYVLCDCWYNLWFSSAPSDIWFLQTRPRHLSEYRLKWVHNLSLLDAHIFQTHSRDKAHQRRCVAHVCNSMYVTLVSTFPDVCNN